MMPSITACPPIFDDFILSSKRNKRLKSENLNLFYILFIHAVFSVELIDTSTGLCSFLLSCIERMTFGANFYAQLRLCRTCLKCISTVACHCTFLIVWMDSFFHFFHLFYSLIIYIVYAFSNFKQLINCNIYSPQMQVPT